jgi:WD40 repeat protein
MPMSIKISPKGKYLAVVLKDRSIRIFNIKTGKNIGNINEPLSGIS